MGGILLYRLLYFWLRTQESRVWSVTDGMIVDNNIVLKGNPRSGYYYYVKFHYEYSVKGRHYYGERFSFAGDAGFRKWTRAREFLDDYPAGKRIDVYFDPLNPNDAVLKRDEAAADAGLLWGMVAGAILILLGLFYLLVIAPDMS